MAGWNVLRDYENETRLEGVISHTFGAPRLDWTAGIIKAKNGDPLAQGCRFRINDLLEKDQNVTLIGHWNNDPKWGWQFVADCIELPGMGEIIDKDGLAEYLANDDEFKKIGPVKAKLIAEEFGDTFDEVLRNEPERIASIAKLSLEEVLNIQEVWCEREDVNAISTWLAGFGVTAAQIKKIAKIYGNSARQKIEQNPYCLNQDIPGIGFLTNDKIALQMGVDPLCEFRLRAGIMHIINELHEQGGHTYIPAGSLIREVIKNLYLDALNSADLVRDQMEYLIESGDLAKVELAEGIYIGAAWLQAKEMYILERFINNEIPEEQVLTPGVISMDLTDEQLQAVNNAVSHKISVVTGGAGVGKSYTIKAILDVFRTNDMSVAICTPTGKAARRLQADGVYAQTIHRTLEYNPFLGGFIHNASNLLPVDAVIIDEVSMCSVPLLWDLFQALDNKCRVVLVGDHNQLPPIGPGNTLKDLCEYDIVPVSYLTKCHRNAGKLKENCQTTLRGILPRETVDVDISILPDGYEELSNTTPQWSVVSVGDDDYAGVIDLLYILYNSKLAEWGYDPLLDVQVISPQNPGPLGVGRINQVLQWINQNKLGNPIPFPEGKQKAEILIGDKVMQIRNNYVLPRGLMNGTQGIIKDVINIDEKCGLRYECPNSYKCYSCEHRRSKDSSGHFLIQFDDRDELLPISRNNGEADELTLAYAVTVHKVQGSQYPCVIAICSKAHTYMLSRNLIYTAVTRSRISCIVLGDLLGMKRAVSTLKDMSRNTWTALHAQEKCIQQDQQNQDQVKNQNNNNEVALVG